MEIKKTDYYSSHLYKFDFPKNLIQFPKSDFIKFQAANAKTGQAVGAQLVVYDYLIASGIGAQITYQGYGKSRPIASQDSSSGRQLNRRVAFKIIGFH